MDHKDPPLFARLNGSSVGDSIAAIHEIYAEADAATSRFSLLSGIECPSDCGGVCCRGFEPDITEAEAQYLAAHLIESGHDIGTMLKPGAADGEFADPGAGSCPFWDSGGSGRCKVYAGRGLICRLFGFSAMRGARGGKSFNLCFKMDGGRNGNRRLWRAGEGDFFEIADPPVMADYGSRVAAIIPGGVREGIGAATARALARITLILRFGGSPGGSPGGEGPLPRDLGPASGAA